MLKPIVATLLISHSIFAQVSKTTHKNELLENIKDLKVEISTKYKDLSGPIDKASIYNFSLSTISKLDLGNEFFLYSKLNLSHESGTTRAKFDETRYSPASRFSATYAYAAYNILDLLELEAGALDNTNDLATSSLIATGATALGIRERVTFENEVIKVNANATQSQPSNSELSNRLDRDESGTPRFFSEFINIEFTLYDHALGIKGGQFAYENLSSVTAYSDNYAGNTIYGNTETNSEYAYKFKGRMLETYLKLKLTADWNINLQGGFSKNNSAKAKNANFAKIESIYNFDGFIVQASYTQFKMESDATVAFYNNSDFRNNSEGSVADLRFKSQSGLETSFEYSTRKVIESSIYLSNENIFKFTLRKTYDLF